VKRREFITLLGGAREQRRWHVEAERFRGLEIDDEFVLGGHLHGQVGRLRGVGAPSSDRKPTKSWKLRPSRSTDQALTMSNSRRVASRHSLSNAGRLSRPLVPLMPWSP
jgi:hypothetical protein